MSPPPGPDRLASAMQAVYAAVPEEFMAVRSRAVAEAKAAKDAAAAREIGKLRKASVAGWAVNLVAREEPELVEDLLDLGERMRSAQARLDTSTLTSLRPDRDRLVAAFVEAAVGAVQGAGRTLSAAAQQEVRATAIAALADAEAATAVSSGQLTRALSYSGFGEVDLSDAVFRTTSGAILTVVPGGGGRGSTTERRTHEDLDREGDTEQEGGSEQDGGRQHHDAEAELVARLAEAQTALDQAAAAVAAAEAEVETARAHAEDTRERLALVERQLAKAREADERALEEVTEAVRRRKQAVAAQHTAQQELDRARAEAPSQG